MLLIYLSTITPRSEFIFEYIFTQQMGILFNTTTDIAAFERYAGEKINYSQRRIGDTFFIKATSLLRDNSIKKIEVPVAEKYETKILFANDECDVGFDIFSAVFYMLSRYEEYLPFTPDKYGRFKATDSLAYKNNFLQIPAVDKWIILFKNILQNKFPSLEFKPSKFEVIVTYDIDVAYKFIGRNFIRNTGSTMKDVLKLDFKNIKSRKQIRNDTTHDPWDVYDYLQETITKNKLPSIFFFLLADKTMHDRNLDYKNPVMKSVINKIKMFSEIGIHPSFKTSLFPEKIVIEKQRLEKIADKNIIKSRQHFLKFILPDTFNALINAGISQDYSMGFPYHAGFRAGTSKPFYFYDLKNEKSTHLKIFPFTFMEGNFMLNTFFDKEKIIKNIFVLIDEVKKVEGTFISIWHNHTVSETSQYKEWETIHDQMIEKILIALADA